MWVDFPLDWLLSTGVKLLSCIFQHFLTVRTHRAEATQPLPRRYWPSQYPMRRDKTTDNLQNNLFSPNYLFLSSCLAVGSPQMYMYSPQLPVLCVLAIPSNSARVSLGCSKTPQGSQYSYTVDRMCCFVLFCFFSKIFLQSELPGCEVPEKFPSETT